MMRTYFDNLDMSKVTPAQRRTVRHRRLIVERYDQAIRRAEAQEEFARDEVTAAVVEQLKSDGMSVSRSTLYNWYRRWVWFGTIGLLDGRSLGNTPAPDWLLMTVAAIRAQRTRCTLKSAHERATRLGERYGWRHSWRHGWRPHTLAETKRFLKLISPKWTPPPGWYLDAVERPSDGASTDI